jgi:Family of unknown function (DUF5702)
MSRTKYYKEGHITVFLSLILTLILSVVCTTIESARLQGARIQIQNITDMGIFSAFGEYNRDLLEIYDLFFIDMGYGTQDGTNERVNARIKEYAEYNTDADKDLEALSLLRYSDIWRANITSVTSDTFVLATDRNGTAYYSQALAYMENKLGITLVNSLLNQYNEEIVDNQESFEGYKLIGQQNESQIESEKDAYQSDYDAALEEAEGDESEVDIPKPSNEPNPVDTIHVLQASPILGLVMEDSSTLSNKRISNFSQVSSQRELKTGDGTFQAKEDNPLNRALFNEYLFEKFPNYLSENTDNESVLKYQAEYILCGKRSDEANLESVVNKLLLMREGINFVYLLTDNVKRTEAMALATAIVGYLGPLAVQMLELVLLLAWAFAESVLEVRMLLSGKKVALLKNTQNWNLSLENLANLSDVLDSGEEDEGGIDYAGYLKMLMFFSNTNKKVTRSLDLIELTVQASNQNFRIDNCTQGFSTTIQYEIGNLFLRLPFKTIERGSDSYHYSVTRDYSYY